MPTIDYGTGYNYFNKHSCIIPDRTTLEVSEDCKTVTIIADEGTCFGPTQPTITVWSSYRGDIVATHAPMQMSADRKRLTYTYASQAYFIYKCQVENAWTYLPEMAGVTDTPHGHVNMYYDTDLEKYQFEFIADCGYDVKNDGSMHVHFYAEYDDTTPAVSAGPDLSWPVEKRAYFGSGIYSGWESYKRLVWELDTETYSDESAPAIVNNTSHTSYVVRSGWDADNQTFYNYLEINFDNCWYPRSTFQVLVNNVAQQVTTDIDFYYKRSCKVTLDLTDLVGSITIDGGVYHRAWPYLEGGAYSVEDRIVYDCAEGYRIEYDIYQGAYHNMLWTSIGGVRYWFNVNETRTSGWLDASFYEGNQTPVWLNALTVYGETEAIPQANATISYSLTNCTVQGTAPTTTPITSMIQLTLVANSGYQFNNPPTISYIDDWDNRITVNGTVSNDKSTAYIDFNPNSVDLADMYSRGSGTFWIAATAAVAPAPPFSATIVNNISGATYTQTNDNINVYAPTGYVFSAAPTLDWTDGTNSGTATFTLAADGKSAVISATAWRTSAYTLTIQGAIEQEHTWGPSSITNNVAHTNQSLSGTTLTLVCDNGYQFDAAPVIAQAGSAGPITMTLNADSTIATADITSYDELAVVISGSTSVIPTPPQPSTNHTVYTRLTNCTGSGIPGTVSEADTLMITLTANTGYEFDMNYLPSVDYIKSDDLTYHEYFTVSSDGLSASITLGLSMLNLKTDSAITIVGQAYETEPTPPGPEPPYTDKYGMVNVYNPTSSELQQFAAQRFRYDQQMNPFDDLGNYVTSLKIVYVSIPATTATTIKAGRYSTNIATRTPTTDLITLDFGSILLPAHNLDILDYSSKVSLFLPFVGFVDVNPEFCGSRISLTYEINIVTGEGVAKLSRNNIVFAMYPCKPSSDMAYKSNTMMSQTLGGGEFNTMYLYGLKPYAIVKWYSTKNQHLLNNDCNRGVIGTYQGYAKFTEVTDINNGQITADEKNLLIRTLAGGVYIETNEP